MNYPSTFLRWIVLAIEIGIVPPNPTFSGQPHLLPAIRLTQDRLHFIGGLSVYLPTYVIEALL
jgi:hypothetical protein